MEIFVNRRIKNYSIVLAIIACVMFILLGYFTYWEVKDVQLQSFEEIGHHYTLFAERALNDIVEHDKLYMDVLTTNEFLMDFTEDPYDVLLRWRTIRFVETLAEDIKGFKTLSIKPIDLPLNGLHIGEPMENESEFNISKSFFETNKFYISPIKYVDGRQEFSIVAPIYKNNKPIGRLQITIDITDELMEIVNKTHFKTSGFMFVINGEAEVVGYPSNDVYTEKSHLVMSDLISNYDNSVFDEAQYNGVNRYFYMRSIDFSNQDKNYEMFIVFTQETEELFSFNEKIMMSTIRVLVIFIVLFILLSRLYGLKYSKLINRDTKQVVEKQLDTEVEKQTRELRKLADTDSLTHLYNHGSMYRIVKSEIEEVIRKESHLTLLMLDLDYFKEVNDRYGHQIGDEVLISISELLVDNIREIDVAGRYGGEEFIILLRDTHLDMGYAVAERIRKTVLASDFTKEKIKLTLSIGIAEWHDEDVAMLIKRADKKLYESKSYGRNKTTF